MFIGMETHSDWDHTHHEHGVVAKLVLVYGSDESLVISLTNNLPVRVVLRPVVQALWPGAVLSGPQPQPLRVGVAWAGHGKAVVGELLILDGFLLATELLAVTREFVAGDVFSGCMRGGGGRGERGKGGKGEGEKGEKVREERRRR